jgi:hypothetical protein
MIKHIVMWKFLEFAEGADKAANLEKAKLLLESLKMEISEIRSLEVGIGMTKGDQAFDLVLSSIFDSRGTLAAYQAHPEHVRVVHFLRKVQSQKAVIDYPW